MNLPSYILSLYHQTQTRFLEYSFGDQVVEKNSILYWKAKILFSIILTAVTTGLLAYFPAFFLAITEKLWILLIIDTIAFGIGIFLLFTSLLSFRQKVGIALGSIYLLGVVILSQVGPLSGGPIWLFTFALLAGVLLGPKAALIAFGINIITTIIAILFFSGSHEMLNIPFFKSTEAMLAAVGSFLFLNGLAAVSVSVLIKGMETAVFKEKEMADNLKIEHTKLVDARKRYSTLFESANDAIIVLNMDLEIIECNLKAVDILGIEKKDILGSTPIKFSPKVQPEGKDSKQGLQEIQAKLMREKSVLFEWTQVKNGNQLYDVEVSLSLVEISSAEFIFAIVRDITLRKQLNEMMLLNEKMISIGGLAAGMAHEINNPLSGIINNLEVVLNRVGKNLPANLKAAHQVDIDFEKIEKYLEKRKVIEMLNSARSAGQKAAKLVLNMLSFSYEGDSDFEESNICELLDETIELANNDYNLKKKYDFRLIEIKRIYSTQIPKITCDKSSIKQVFFNILKNGAHAMSESGMDPKKEPAKFILRVSAGKENRISIEMEDNGPGIDPEIINQIFNPFFTTKRQGVGTGLGLWISYFIIQEKHKGTITVDSTLGKGTRFIIDLPLSIEK